MIRYRPFRYKKNSILAVIIILLAAALSFPSLNRLFGFRQIILSSFYPFHFVSNAVWKGTTGIPGFILGLHNLQRENAALKEQLDIASPKLALYEELTAENERLSALLGFKTNNAYRLNLLPAKVIARQVSFWFSVLEVNRGSLSGVRLNLPVVAKEGLVGRVVEVGRYSSKVLLISDVNSEVSAVDQRSRAIGLVEGYSPDKFVMKYVPAGGDVKVGDKIVSSSVSGVFPPGIPVGEVTYASRKEHNLFYHIEIKPAVNFSALEEVFLVF